MPREVKVKDDILNPTENLGDLTPEELAELDNMARSLGIPDLPSDDDILDEISPNGAAFKEKAENVWDLAHPKFNTLAKEKDFDNWVLRNMGIEPRPKWKSDPKLEARDILSWHKELRKFKK